MEILFSLLAVPDDEQDEVSSDGLRATFQMLNTIAQTRTAPQTRPEDPLPWVLSLRDLFTLPREATAL